MAVLKFLMTTAIIVSTTSLCWAAETFTKEQFSSLKNFSSQKMLNDEKETDYRVLYFWATWCPDCKEKITGDLNSVASSRVQVYAVATDKDSAKIQDYLTTNKVLVPVLEDKDKKFQKMAQVFAVPTVMVFKKAGTSYERIFVKSGATTSEIKEQVQL